MYHYLSHISSILKHQLVDIFHKIFLNYYHEVVLKIILIVNDELMSRLNLYYFFEKIYYLNHILLKNRIPMH